MNYFTQLLLLTLLHHAFITFVWFILEYASHSGTHLLANQQMILNMFRVTLILAYLPLSICRIPNGRHSNFGHSGNKTIRFRSHFLLQHLQQPSNSCNHFSVFTPSSLNTRSSGTSLVSSIHCIPSLCNKFFSRNTNLWNCLPYDIKLAHSLSTFKR